MTTKHIRNFSIIAHIDHGKSTLADRIIETCGAVEKRDMQAQILDSMDIERERGITIKANAIALNYTAKDGQQYRFHLIDTPGHVDFTYEVSRSLAGCEGAVLVVDATQGVEAQTLANVYLAMENNLEIIPILNKIDLPSADPERIRKQVEEVVGLDASDALGVSGKTGQGVPELLEQIVQKIPAPTGDIDAPLKVLLMDAAYDNYLGVVLLVRVIDGELKKGQKIRLMSNGQAYTVERTGISTPKRVITDSLKPGEVGFMTAALKTVEDVTIGDTITLFNNPCAAALPGFKKVQPMVFCGLYPTEAEDFEKLKESLGKLRINDTSFTYMPEASAALGFGFRCGFLGLLHMEIIQERLEREFDLDLVTTAPGVVYKIRKTDGVEMTIENPADLPEMNFIDAMMEPIIKATILVPEKYVGDVMSLCIQKRGQQTGQGVTFIGGGRVMLTFKIPLNEVVLDFYDKLKSITSGYASFDYEHESFQESSLAKVNILINGELVDALSMIVHRESAERKGRALLKKLKELIPRQMFEVNLQAAIGAKVIASERLSAMRKDVTAKCYGGDITRKRKLLEKQKKGKKRMKSIGRVDIPQEAFLAALKMED